MPIGPRVVRSGRLPLVLLLLALLAPSTASATHHAYLDAVTPNVAGCQVKGLFALPSPKQGGPGLAPGGYYYIVTPYVGGADVGPSCPAVLTAANGSASQDAVLLQWNVTPGATTYRAFRGTFNPATGAILTAPQLLATGQPNSIIPAGCSALRCVTQDVGYGTTAVSPPAGAAAYPQAGGHPDLTITQRVDYGGLVADSPAIDPTNDDPYSPNPAIHTAALKTDEISFPPGLVANPRATAVCPLTGPNSLLGDTTKFGSPDDPNEDTCPRSTQVGTVASLTRTPSGITPTAGDIYNGATKAGEPARLFIVLRPLCSAGSPVAPGSATCQAVLGGGNTASDRRQVEKQFLAAVSTINKRDDGTYGIDVDVVEAEDDHDLAKTLNVLVPNPGNGNLLFRGGAIPIQVRQITQRLFGYADQGTAATSDDVPFVTLPTSCGAKTMTTAKTTHDDATEATGSATFTTTGCENVPFSPSTEATVDTTKAEAPVGFANATVLAANDNPIHQSHIRKITAAFPPGLVLSSSSGAAIQAVGAQLGSVSGFSDELGALGGTLTLQSVGTDAAGHFNGSMVVRATVTDGKDTVLTLDGPTTADPATGQLKAVFDNLPEVPFKRLNLSFNGGPNAPLVNPPTCGTHTVRQDIESWSGAATASPTATFTTSFDGQGGTCPATRPFAPTLTASTSPTTAGAFTALTTKIERADGQQALSGFTLELPNGMLAKLGTVPFCPSASADLGTCAASTQVGTVKIAAGTGSSPVSLPGTISLAEAVPGTGDVASLVVAIPVKVGPFDVGTVVSRARLQILFDPEVGVRVTTTGKLPVIAGGIPVRVRTLELLIDKAGFQRNPSNCDSKDFVATFTSQGDPTTPTTAAEGGTTSKTTWPFQASNCDALPFSPKVAGTVDAKGATGKGGHPALTVTVSQNADEAATKSANVKLPNTLTANLAGLATPCTETQLAANQCPAGATVGEATATSPLLPVALSGSIVAIEQAADLPKLAVLLKGPLNVRLDATVQLDTSVAGQVRIINVFPSIPDVPLSTFTLKLKGGPTGLLTNTVSLCSGAGTLDGVFNAHNRKTATVSSPLAVTGATVCPPGAPAVNGSLFGVKRGRPELSLEVSREGAKAKDRIKSVRMTLPKGMTINKSGARRRLVVTGGGKKLSRTTYKLTSRVLSLSKLGTGKTGVRLFFKPGSLRETRTIRRRARNQTLTFRLRVVDRTKRVYNLSVRLKPRS